MLVSSPECVSIYEIHTERCHLVKLGKDQKLPHPCPHLLGSVMEWLIILNNDANVNLKNLRVCVRDQNSL